MVAYIEQLIKMRSEIDPALLDRYESSFRKASKFVVLDGEFVPFELVESQEKGKARLKSIVKEYGKAKVKTKFDKKLSKFYRKHGLKRDIDHIVDNIAYVEISPTEVVEPKADKKTKSVKKKSKKTQKPEQTTQEEVANTLYKTDQVDILSSYQSTPYSAKDSQLKSIGRAFGDDLVAPTNQWLENLDFEDFEKVPERYWQVAGSFKRRIWGKLLHKDHVENLVFFCVGIDLENLEVFYGLECLRTGTSKLSTEQIFKFDHFTKGNKIWESYQIDEISYEQLLANSQKFIAKCMPLYYRVIDFIWNDKVDLSLLKNRLTPLSTKISSLPTVEISLGKKTLQGAVAMVVDYERELLIYKGKDKLAKKVKADKSSSVVHSFETDGTKRLISVIATKSKGIVGATIDQDTVAQSHADPDHSFLYVVTQVDTKQKTGLLHQASGQYDRILNLEPRLWEVGK